MAIFHMQINTVSRSSGRNAPASAAYRAGERIRNERTGVVYDHRNRRDILHKEIVLPSRLAGSEVAREWAGDRSRLWNAAERIESKENSRVAREYMVALPAELPAAQRVQLAQSFSREIADRYNVAVDLAVHAPRPLGDPRNFHAHLLATTREVRPEGLGPKAGLDMNGTTRAELGLPSGRKEFAALRARWAELVNERLRTAHLEARVDSRSLAAQGIEREPSVRLPWAAFRAERRGERSEVAERLRARYRARVAARAQSVAARSDADRRPGGQLVPPHLTRISVGTASGSEQRRREAARDWLASRDGQAQQAGRHSESSSSSDADQVRRNAAEAWRSLRAKESETHGRANERDGIREAEPTGEDSGPRTDQPRDFSL